MRPALEKYMNFNKRGFKQLAAARQSPAIIQCSEEKEGGGRQRKRKTKGKQREKTLSVIATPLPNC